MHVSIINKITVYTCVCPGDRTKINLAAGTRPPYVKPIRYIIMQI